MDPIDYRTACWQDIQGRLQGLRLAVLSAWRQHGPGTTREVSAKSGIDILTFRPRTTELYQIGFIAVVEDEQSGTKNQEPRTSEGIYRALSDGEAWELFQNRQRDSRDAQLALKI